MFALLSPRLWLALALAGALAFSHFTVYRAGKNHVRLEWTAATAQANVDARKLEQLRQSRADEAARVATARTHRLAADARSARAAADSLRGAVESAERAAKESTAAAEQYRATCGKLLIESGELLAEIARGADGHSSDVKLLLDAWPK